MTSSAIPAATPSAIRGPTSTAGWPAAAIRRARALPAALVMALLAAGAGPLAPAARAQEAARGVPTTAELDGLRLRSIGPANMSGRVVDLAVVDADPTTFYIASATGGVWKTVDGGIRFTPVFYREPTISVGDMAVSQADTSVVWVGTGERASRQSNSWGDGVYRSTDGGRTWTNMGLKRTREIGRIRIDPKDPSTVYVAAMGHLWGPNPERGLYRTTDAGRTWTKVLYIDENTGVSDVAIDPGDPSVVYAASYQRRRRPFGFDGGGPGSALWKSTDGGAHWTKLTAGLPGGEWGRVGIALYRRDPKIIYVSIEKGWRYNASTAYVRPDSAAGIFRSDDGGAHWRHMGSWNPRPMYASQPYVDPNDDCRVYMENSFSVSTDCGRTFHRVRTGMHGDDRYTWVDPSDSRHMIHADDGGIGMSWDRGRTWLYQTALPLSQWYHVRTDNAVPYHVYGGLQDNGCWTGPSATYRREGILNEDWRRTCGGDGFLSIPDTVDPHIVYASSQYLGLVKHDTRTWQTQDIRPGDPHGHITARRNFEAWFTRTAPGALGNAWPPANWDAPYIISPFDHNTLYAGTSHLWKSTDAGAHWTDLGDMTTGVDRRDLTIMGRPPTDTTPSLDDGAPYYPTLTAIAASPLLRGLLYVGTDDGNVKVSRDGGRTWTELRRRIPGLPAHDSVWVNMIEASAHDTGTVYLAMNNYRNDDYGNYLYRSTDYGRHWASITGDLPPERVVRAVREDPRNPRVLWLGTELGAFVSIDAGAHWTALGGGLPTVPVNDLVIQPHMDDLVLATHGRGVWILDDVAPIQQLSPAVMAAAAHLFTVRPATLTRYTRGKAQGGTMVFHGQNPPDGAIISYWLAARHDSGDVALAVLGADGRAIAHVDHSAHAGMNRAIWDLRADPLPAPPGGRGAGRVRPGPRVAPGTYTVRLTVAGRSQTQTVAVRPDPRLPLGAAALEQWSADERRIADAYRGAVAAAAALHPLAVRARAALGGADAAGGGERNAAGAAGPAAPLDAARARRVMAVARPLDELVGRLGRLLSAVDDWTGPMTGDQRSQIEFFEAQLKTLGPRARALAPGR